MTPRASNKTGVVFAAYLNGHQSHFRMVGGLESARSIVHLSEQFRLMDAAGLLRDPEIRRPSACPSGPGPSPGSSSGAAVALAPGNHYKADLRAIRFTLWDHLGTRTRLFALERYKPLVARGVRRRHRPGVPVRHRGERPAQLRRAIGPGA